MSNTSNLIRSVVVYSICLPLAVILGYLLTNPLDFRTFGVVGVVFFVLSVPLLLRFHHVMLVFAWNSSILFLFLPGRPYLWFLLSMISLLISVGRRTLDSHFRFVSAPEITRPLIALVAIILFTAHMTGGIGVRVLGGDTYGGKRYLYLLGAVAGYFALTAHRVPLHRAGLYVGLFFLAATTNVIGDFYHLSGPLSKFIYLFFQPHATGLSSSMDGATRYIGVPALSGGVFSFMLARYGIRGIFDFGRPWRIFVFTLFCGLGLFGGFRSLLMTLVLVFVVQFFLEGCHRTRLLPGLLLVSMLIGIGSLPLLRHFPLQVQRALAFLPVPIDPIVRQDAQGSSGWRVRLWKAVLPQVPKYLWLGKGLSLSAEDFVYSQEFRNKQALTEDQSGTALAGDYHNGPLSVIIPFGIWGVIAFLWLIISGLRVLYKNYRYGDPRLKTVNTLLLSSYIVKLFMFFVVVGGLTTDIHVFLGWLALSLTLNGGVARPVPTPVPAVMQRPRPTGIVPRPRPAFGRQM